MARINPLIFGGSFDPFHNAHLELINSCIKEKYKPIYVIPTYISPVGKNFHASFEERIQLCKAGTAQLKNVIISDFEKKKNETCYSIDQVRWVKKNHENEKISLLVGEDNLKDIKNWKNYSELIDNCNIVVARRMESEKNNKTTFLKSKIMEISSSEIRRKIKEKKSVKNLLPKLVEEKILKRGLYK